MSNQCEVVIVSACRTPVGRFLGGLSTTPAPRLGAVAVQRPKRGLWSALSLKIVIY